MEGYFGNYKILIDGRWSLENLYSFPRSYEQVYFAIEALLPAEDQQTETRLERAFQAYPWQGGYSAVNFYNALRHATPPPARPSVVSLKYASPGWIELLLNVPLALQIAGTVSAVAGSLAACNKVYHQIHVNLQQRKLLRIDVERQMISLTKEEISLVSHSFKELSEIINLERVEEIHRRTNNPLVSLKILLSIYRRLRELAEFQNRGKADFPSPRIIRPSDDS